MYEMNAYVSTLLEFTERGISSIELLLFESYLMICKN